MRPAFLPGDRLYADPTPGRPLVRGDVVVAHDPERPGRLILKRVSNVGVGPPPVSGGAPSAVLTLVGDAPDESRDSRQFGPVPLSAIVGVVWFRYAPAERRGGVEGVALN